MTNHRDGTPIIYVTSAIWRQEFNKLVQSTRLAGMEPNLNCLNIPKYIGNELVMLVPMDIEDEEKMLSELSTNKNKGCSEYEAKLDIPVQRGRGSPFRRLRKVVK